MLSTISLQKLHGGSKFQHESSSGMALEDQAEERTPMHRRTGSRTLMLVISGLIGATRPALAVSLDEPVQPVPLTLNHDLARADNLWPFAGGDPDHFKHPQGARPCFVPSQP